MEPAEPPELPEPPEPEGLPYTNKRPTRGILKDTTKISNKALYWIALDKIFQRISCYIDT